MVTIGDDKNQEQKQELVEAIHVETWTVRWHFLDEVPESAQDCIEGC